MTILLQDIHYSVRSLLKNRTFTLVALATLALGIGVNTALFTLFNIFLRPKPIKDPDTVVRLEYEGARREQRFSFQDYSHLRDHAQVFSDVIANFEDKFLLGEKTPGAEPEEIPGNFVSENYLSALGGELKLGRFFTPDENRIAGRDAVVVLSHHFWQRRFSGDPGIVGRSVLLNGRPFTVIGVTSSDFVGLRYEMPDIWLPLMMRGAMPTVHFEEVELQNRDWFGKQDFQWLSLHGRLKAGRTLAEARAEVNLLVGQLDRLRDEAGTPRALVNVVPASDDGGDNPVWRTMLAVLGASGLVLLIACSNIANMLLARASSRQKEIGLRLCLGASRWRVIRQLLTESFLLAACGGVVGILLAWWTLNAVFTSLVSRYGGGDVIRLAVDLSPDLRVLGFSLLLSLLSGIAFGLVPALRVSRPDLISVLKDEGAGATGRVSRSWLRNGLVVGQVALCVVLLVAAGLLLRGLSRVLHSDPGFAQSKLLSINYSLELSGYDTSRAQLFHQQLTTRLSALPGVTAVTQNSEFAGRVTVKLPNESQTTTLEFDRVPMERVTSNFLDTIGTPLVSGRGFTVDEARAKAPVVIVSESMARNVWPAGDAIGQTFSVERPTRNGSVVIFPRAEVIGIARDNEMYRVGQIPPLLFYAPQAELTEWLDTSLFVRTTSDAAAMKELVRREAFSLEPVLRLDVRTMTERIARNSSVNETRAASELAACLGGLALLLAAIGIYGVVAWSVAQRTREMGIRMALGARGQDVMMLVIKHGMRLTVIGMIFGTALSLAVMQFMKSWLLGLSSSDPLTFVAVPLLLGSVAVFACYLPARRATRVDPLVALRYE